MKERIAYSRAEAAELSSLSVRSIDYLIEKGELKARKVGRRTLVSAQSLKKLVDGALRQREGEIGEA